MSAVSTQCQCCGEDSGKLARFDGVLGAICHDCSEGLRISRASLERNNIRGVFTGKCGDNERGGAAVIYHLAFICMLAAAVILAVWSAAISNEDGDDL